MSNGTPRHYDEAELKFAKMTRRVSGKVTVPQDFHSRLMHKIRETPLSLPGLPSQQIIITKKTSIQKGEGAIEAIQDAKESIDVTHISRDTLAPHYIKTLR